MCWSRQSLSPTSTPAPITSASNWGRREGVTDHVRVAHAMGIRPQIESALEVCNKQMPKHRCLEILEAIDLLF